MNVYTRLHISPDPPVLPPDTCTAQEQPDDYRAAQSEVGEALTSAAAAVLSPAVASDLSHGGANNEFTLRLGGAMSEWGSKHIHTLTQDQRSTFLQQVPRRSVSYIT
jgi:hypothetical protein